MNMREIIFRGKDKYENWRYGQLITNSKIYGIIEEYEYACNSGALDFSYIKVDRETVGQFTGLFDNTRTEKFPDGKPIYEGDIVQFYYYDEKTPTIGKVIYHGSKFACKKHKEDVFYLLRAFDMTVIGNIHDNPELFTHGLWRWNDE